MRTGSFRHISHWAALAAVTTFACQGGDPGAKEAVGRAEQATYVEAEGTRTVLWPDPSNIPVCWEVDVPPGFDPASKATPPPGYTQTVQQAVTTEYARAGLVLTGWQDCAASSKGIRIYLYDQKGGNGVQGGFGSSLDGVPGGLYLHPGALEFTNTALHEFGHAMGLHHEMNRRDNTDPCETDQMYGRGEKGVTPLGDYDQDSIMGYCRDRSKNVLSDGDVRTLKAYYEGPVATTSGEPIKESSTTALAITVSGRGVTHYKYKLGPAATIDCKLATGYGSERPVAAPITDDISELSDGPVRLCVLGKSASGRWQANDVYTSAYWIKVYDFRCLWPVDNTMVDAEIGAPADGCVVTSIVSSEAEQGLGSNDVGPDTGPDHETVSGKKMKLRAERFDFKLGRTYDVQVTCAVATGAVTRRAVVRVPPNQSAAPWIEECDGRMLAR